MAGYLINKSHCDDSVVSIKELDGYTFKPKKGKGNYIKVNEDKYIISAVENGELTSGAIGHKIITTSNKK